MPFDCDLDSLGGSPFILLPPASNLSDSVFSTTSFVVVCDWVLQHSGKLGLQKILLVFLRARYVSKILFYILFFHHICMPPFQYVTGFNFFLQNLSGVHVYPGYP